LVDHGMDSLQADGIYEADTLRAGATAGAPVIDMNAYTGHALDFVANLRGKVGQRPPQAAAGAAVANGEQFFAWTHAQPNRIQLVASDQVDQACFATALYVGQGFLSRSAVAQRWMDLGSGLSQEQAP
jgi:hypothetical protein